MAVKEDPQLGVNSWFEEELREQYQHDRSLVDESWKHLFEGNGTAKNAKTSNGTASALSPALPANGTAKPAVANGNGKVVEAGPGEELMPLRGAAAKIAENMSASLSIPLATSQRTIPVKVIDENRRLINHHRSLVID